MRSEERARLSDESQKSLETFLARASRYAQKGIWIPRVNGVEQAQIRRTIARLRRGEIPPPWPDMTQDEAIEILELALEQEEIIRDTARDMRGLRAMERGIAEREAREQAERDMAAFTALKAEASRHGGDDALVRELNRARRAAGGRRRGR